MSEILGNHQNGSRTTGSHDHHWPEDPVIFGAVDQGPFFDERL